MKIDVNLPILPTGAPIAGSLVGAFEGGAPRLVGRGEASRRSRSRYVTWEVVLMMGKMMVRARMRLVMILMMMLIKKMMVN